MPAAASASSTACMGRMCFPTATRIFAARTRNTSIPCGFLCASCGATRPPRAIRSTSTSGRPISILPEPMPDPHALPSLPRNGGGPVFAEPWQAHAFALAVKLSEAGLFTWSEWAAALAAELAAASDRGEPDDGSRYYQHWLAVL